MKYIDIAKTIKDGSALTQEQGDIIYHEIISAFQNDEPITLDFKHIESMISPFLNSSIGRLYEKYDSEQIRKNLKLDNFPKEKNSTLNVVISNAKKYYANKGKYTRIVKEVIDNE